MPTSEELLDLAHRCAAKLDLDGKLRHVPSFSVAEEQCEDEYETLSGFVMVSLGRVPQPADRFEWHGLKFEVMDMDGRRVDKVLVTTLGQRAGTHEEGNGKK